MSTSGSEDDRTTRSVDDLERELIAFATRVLDSGGGVAVAEGVAANVEDATDQQIVGALRGSYVGYQGLTEPLEREMLRRLRATLPGFEHGRIERYSFAHYELVDVPAIYVRWRNGPDLYEIVEPETPMNLVRRNMVCRVWERWTKIVKKEPGAAPREPFDVASFVAALNGEESLSLWHAVQHWSHRGDQRFLDMIDADPERAEDICHFYVKKCRGILY